jgi:hypothetical protein
MDRFSLILDRVCNSFFIDSNQLVLRKKFGRKRNFESDLFSQLSIGNDFLAYDRSEITSA